MSCSPFDLRDYFLKELPDPERRQVDSHLKSCPACREELDRLRLTEAALFSLRDEEIPQRIAFVSDKVFEPSPARRWWSALWSSGPRLGFASAAMLSAAILVSALTRPAAAPTVAAPGMTAAAIQQEIDQRVSVAVQKTAAEIEARQQQRTTELVSAIEKRNEFDRKALVMAMDKNFEYMSKRLNRFNVASNEYGPPRTASGEPR
jgi:anti-sigma factor RsiW